MQSSQTSKSPTRRRLLIVDGHAFAYRAFFAIRSLSSPDGAATNAIYGFIRMLGKMHSKVRPTHLIVVWDGGLARERMTLLPEYKAHRPEMPANLSLQLDQIIAYLHAAGVYSLLQEGCEADDSIAVLASRAVSAGFEIVIASSDKDFMQLVSDDVRLLNPNDKTDTLWGAEEVLAKTGVKPTQIVDWLSLIGDSVDNIPGVPGIGSKTASELLRQFGSIDSIYQRIEEIGQNRLRSSLQASEGLLRRNQQLVRLKSEMECEVSLEDLVCKPVDSSALRQLYAGWGFKTLLRELEQERSHKEELFPETAGVP